MKLCILQNIRVELCYTIYAMTIVDIHMCHMNAVFLIDDIGRLILHSLSQAVIQLTDNWKEMWHYSLHIVHRPCLKRLC